MVVPSYTVFWMAGVGVGHIAEPEGYTSSVRGKSTYLKSVRYIFSHVQRYQQVNFPYFTFAERLPREVKL